MTLASRNSDFPFIESLNAFHVINATHPETIAPLAIAHYMAGRLFQQPECT
jgi:hypothetical protein